MDPNDGVIEAEADISQRLRSSSRSSSRSDTHAGARSTLIAPGGFSRSAADGADERTPLTSKFGDGKASIGPNGGDATDGGDEDEWPGQKDFEGLPWWKRPSMLWIIGPFILYALAYGGMLVPKTNLIQDILCRDYFTELARDDPDFTYTPIMFGQSDKRCETAIIEKKTTNFMTGATVIAGLLSAVTSPLLGEMSDYYGRKRILSVVVSGSLVSEILTLWAAMTPETFPIYWIYLGYACEGFAGSFIAGMALVNAYGADCTPPSRRNVAFGYFHGGLFTGIALGPLLAAWTISVTNTIVVVFITALVFHLIFILFLVFIIPESLSPRRQHAAREKRKKAKLNDRIIQYGDTPSKLVYGLVSFFRPLKMLWPTGPGSSPALRRNLAILAAIDFTVFGVAMGAMTVITVYIRKQFEWDVARQSIYMSSVNISRVTFLVVALPLITKLVRRRQAPASTRPRGCDSLDLTLIRTAVFLDTLGYLGYTLARSGALFTLSGMVAAAGGMASPTLQSSLTKHVPHDRTGQLLGATGLLHAIARTVAPVIFNTIFARTNDKFRQTVFVCLTATFGVALVLTVGLRKGVFLDEGDAVDEVDTSPEINVRPPTEGEEGEERREGAPEVERG